MIIAPPIIAWYDFDGSTSSTIITGMKDALVGAGWSIGVSVGATRQGTFTGLPTDGQTATIDGTVYTAKNTPAGGNDFQIGADATATATNFAAKITANDPTFDATSSAGTVTLTAITGGPSGNGKVLSESMTNFTWAGTQTEDGGYKLDSGITPDGLQLRLYAYARPNSTAHALFRFMSPDETATMAEADRGLLAAVASRRYRVACCNYEFETYLHNNPDVANTIVAGGVPWLPDDMVATAITNAVNDGTGKIKITATGHSRSTGDQVYISGVVGVPANGLWTITVIDANNFTLNSSTFSGAYVSGGRVGGSFVTGSPSVNKTQISRAIWGLAQDGNSQIFPRLGPGSVVGGQTFVATNETFASSLTGSVGSPRGGFDLTFDRRFVDNRYVDFAAMIRWNAADLGTDALASVQGGMWRTFFINTILTQDTEGNLPAPQSEHFLVYGVTASDGSICILIPATVTTL